MVAGAASLIGMRGVGATSVRELARFTGAPLGSTYHYFPGGKDQLVDEALAWVCVRTERLIASCDDAVAALDAFVASWRRLLEETDYRASCPVLAVAAEEPGRGDDPPPSTAVFQRWHTLIVDTLRRDGVAPEQADALAWTVLASVEGAVVLARSQRSAAPLDAVAGTLRSLVAAAVER